MKKVLLIGELNKMMESMNESLAQRFRVQLCSSDEESAKAMIRIAKPDLIIVSLIGSYDINVAIFDMLYNDYPMIPVLAIGTKEECDRYITYYENDQFERLERPITENDLLEKCKKKLNLSDLEDSYPVGKNNMKEGKSILVVDDSPLVLRNIKAMLEPRYKVFLATSGEQALKCIPKESPDLILLDYEMPEMNGKEVFEKIKADAYSKEIPVIFLTGVADKEHIYAVLQLNPAGYFLKPPNRSKLLEAIEGILSV